MEAVELLVSWIVTTGLTFLAVIVDERRLSEERRERAWPASSRDAAIVSLGPLAIPFHFARTRGLFFSLRGHLRWWLGLGLGVLVMALVLGITTGVLYVFELAFGLPTD